MSNGYPTAGSNNQPASDFNLTPELILATLRRWWLLATVSGALLAATAGGITFALYKPSYEATAWVQIQGNGDYVAFPSQGDSQRFVATQLELIRSPLVLQAVAGLPEIAAMPEFRNEPDAVSVLLKNIQVRVVGQSDLFQIRYVAKDPARAARIANALMETYLDLQSVRNAQQTDALVKLLEQEKTRRAAGLEQLKEKVRVLHNRVYPDTPYIATSGDGAAGPAVTTLTNPLVADLAALTNVEVNTELLRAQRASLEAAVPDVASIKPPAADLEQMVEADPSIIKMKEEIASKKAAIAEYERVSAKGAASAPLSKAQTQLAELEESLAKQKAEARSIVEAAYVAKVQQNAQLQLGELDAKLKSQTTWEEILRSRIVKKREDLERSANRSLELEFARADLGRAEDVFKRIAERAFHLETEKGAPGRVTKLQAARAPAEPMVWPVKLIGVVSGVGFLLPFGVVLLHEIRTRRIATPKQISEEISLDVLGEVTALPMRSMFPSRRSSEKFEQDCTMFEESIDSLRTHLMLADDLRDLQVLVVASAVSREGKTNLAAQLAVSLANCCAEPTLLIDADMRAPDLHEMFEIPQQPGLANILEREAKVDDCIVTNLSNRVHLLPAGVLRRSPHTLLSDKVYAQMLQRLRSRYRFIVVDSPPVLAASESLVIAKHADGTLICTMRDVSRTPQLRLACTRLRGAGAKLLGAVLSGVPMKAYAARYGGYGYYSARYSASYANNESDQTPHDKEEDNPETGAPA